MKNAALRALFPSTITYCVYMHVRIPDCVYMHVRILDCVYMHVRILDCVQYLGAATECIEHVKQYKACEGHRGVSRSDYPILHLKKMKYSTAVGCQSSYTKLFKQTCINHV